MSWEVPQRIERITQKVKGKSGAQSTKSRQIGPCMKETEMETYGISSLTRSCLTLCDPMDCSMPGLPVHHQHLELLRLLSIEPVMPSNHLIPCHSLLLLPSIFPSCLLFSKESVLHIRWPNYWSFSFSISSSNEYSKLISFRIDWLYLPAVQGTLKFFPTPQFKTINCSALSFLYGLTLTSIHDYWKNHSID